MIRQNVQDILHKEIIKDDKTSLKYGISMKIDLKDFKLKRVNLDQDESQISITNKENISIRSLSKKDVSSFKENSFDEFHITNVKNGIVLSVPNNTILSETLIINSRQESKNTLTHLKINVGTNCNLKIINLLSTKNNSKGYNSQFVEIDLDKNSKLDFYHSEKLMNKIHYSRKNFIVKKDSKLNFYELTLDGKIVLSNNNITLEGDNSETHTHNIFFSEKDQQFDILSKIVHKGRNTVSNLMGKGATKDVSKSIYRSCIYVKKNAFKSDGYQRADILMLDKESVADAIPQLLIDNNDVNCAHGIGIGRIDPEKIFYFMSRGIKKNIAKKEIVRGFFESAIKDINTEIISKNLTEAIEVKTI